MENDIKNLRAGDSVEIRCKTGLYRIVKIVDRQGKNFTSKIPGSMPRKIIFSEEDITRIIGKSRCACD